MPKKADSKSSLLFEIKLKFRAKQSSGYTRLYTAYLKIFMFYSFFSKNVV